MPKFQALGLINMETELSSIPRYIADSMDSAGIARNGHGMDAANDWHLTHVQSVFH